MDETNLLLKAYYEALYDRLEARKDVLAARIEELLTEELARLVRQTYGGRGFEDFDGEKYAAYRDACLAFVDERIEAYNPVGVQYTFDRTSRREVLELELQLNWFDSSAEFEELVEAARCKAQLGLAEEQLQLLVDELIGQVGAFPDKSIISAYQAKPALNKLPDYMVARAIEEIICEK